jgi:hypothetical protein
LFPEEKVVHQFNFVDGLDDLSHIQVLLHSCDALLKEDHKFLLLARPLPTNAQGVTEHLPLGVDEVLIPLDVLEQSSVHVLCRQYVRLLQEHRVLYVFLFATERFARHCRAPFAIVDRKSN